MTEHHRLLAITVVSILVWAFTGDCAAGSDKLNGYCIRRGKTIVERYPIDMMAVRNSEGEEVYSVGQASSMVKILPRCRGRAIIRKRDQLSVELFCAKNETEATQIVIHSPRQDLQDVQLVASDLRSDDGKVIKKSSMTFAPVGFVRTIKPEHFKPSYTGWWPDPILASLQTFRIRKSDHQPVWYSVRVPSDASAGEYRGTLTIQIKDQPDCSIPVKLTVWNFTLPKRPSLQTAMSTREWLAYPGVSDEKLKQLQIAYDRFMAAHRFSPGWGIYRPNGKPIPQWRLDLWAELDIASFCITYFHKNDALRCTSAVPKALKDHLYYEMRFTLDRARKAGIDGRGFVYACDEVHEKHFKGLNNACKTIEKLHPGTLVLTTAIDPSFGEKSELKNVNGFVSSTNRYSFRKAQLARRKGKQVWWYFCGGNYPPEPNVFIESPGIDARLFMGFMTYAFQADGVLYWSTVENLGKYNSVQDEGVYTNWNPQVIKGWNGDGYLVYPGPDGPISSIRMENLLDGLEDYEYLILLERKIRRLKESGKEAKAQEIMKWFGSLQQPSADNPLVHSLNRRCLNPEYVEQMRSKIAVVLNQP